jgi:choline-sulfatase
MKPSSLIAAAWVFPLLITFAETSESKPNILFIAIDDQNDWVGHMGGHPLVKTPNLDALAARGTTFLNAHCQSPLCNPSRTSLMFGLRPTTTGIYGLSPAPRAHADVRDRVSLAQHFAAQGYRTYATGKIYHMGTTAGGKPEQQEFDVTAPFGGVGSRPPKKLIGPTPMGNNPLMDWGVWPPGIWAKKAYPAKTRCGTAPPACRSSSPVPV